MLKRILIIFIFLHWSIILSDSRSSENPLQSLSDNTVTFFKPLNFKITKVEENRVFIQSDMNSGIREGMRMDIVRTGQMFYHPVTREPLGQLEKRVGKAEIIGVNGDTAIGVVLSGEPLTGDKVRITRSKIKSLFYQHKTVDWHLGDAYYRELKDTNRFELFDTSLQTDDMELIFDEARKLGAEIIIYLEGESRKFDTILKQRLFWVEDKKEIYDETIYVTLDFIKEKKFGSEFLLTTGNEPILTYNLPRSSELIAIGDLDGDDKEEILLDSSTRVQVYEPAVDLHEMWELKGSKMDEHIYLDTIDLNKNGRDEVIITVSRDYNEIDEIGSDDMTVSPSKSTLDAIHSYIYELEENAFKLLWETRGFLRVFNGNLLTQDYSKTGGFDGKIFTVIWDGNYRKDKPFPITHGINIYNFVTIQTADHEEFFLFYDKNNFLNLYSKDGLPLWRSKKNLGSFIREFKRESPTVMVDRGKWHVSDKMYAFQNEVMVVKRIPITEKTVSLGYKTSQLKKFWWNGLSMEEGILIDKIYGGILDYAFYKGKVYVLSRPPFGIKAKNILKGDNPLITFLFVYPIK